MSFYTLQLDKYTSEKYSVYFGSHSDFVIFKGKKISVLGEWRNGIYGG